ncbi:hypothetical protein, partial [Candidatus Enterococcus courvalinii]
MKNFKNVKRKALIAGLLFSALILPTTANAKENSDLPQTNSAVSSDNLFEATPRISIGTGYKNHIKDTTIISGGTLKIQTNSEALLQVGMGTQTKTVIKIDPEIASEFFSTPNYKKYIHGKIVANPTSGVGKHRRNIEDIWDKKPSIINGLSQETVFYDESLHAIVFKTEKALASVSAYQNIDLEIDLGKWHTDTGKVIERKTSYSFSVNSASADWGIGWNWGGSETSLNEWGLWSTGAPFEFGSWIEDPIKPTSLKTEDDEHFSGTWKQDHKDESNEHETTYSVTLKKGSSTIKSNIPMDDEGNWSADLSGFGLKGGDTISAYVVGIETQPNANGIRDRKESIATRYTIGKDSIPWDQWKVVAPTINDAYDEETLISGLMPNQNLQKDRSYTLKVLVDGKEVYSQDYDGESMEYHAPIFGEESALVKGQTIEAYISGKEPIPGSEGVTLPDKESTHVKTVIKENQEEENTWENWQVNAPEIDRETSEGDTSVAVEVPAQNRFNGRTYEMEFALNGEVVDTKEISTSGAQINLSLEKPLKENDVLTAKVIGHEESEKDKESQVDEWKIVDNTNWSDWQVNGPTLNEVKTTDTQLTGNVNEQDVEAGRTYELKATLNDKEIGTIKVEAGKKFSMDLPEGTTLKEGDKVAVQVIGHQAGKEDKVSEQAKQVVVDGTNWSDWQVNGPTLNEVKTTDTQLTGNVNEQDVEAGRTYELKATLNDKEIGTIKVEAGKEFSMDLPEGTTLKEGDKVAVQVIGHQAGKEDKVSEQAKQVVVDGTNWSDWQVNGPTLNEVKTTDTQLTGNVNEQDVEAGRTYELKTTQK